MNIASMTTDEILATATSPKECAVMLSGAYIVATKRNFDRWTPQSFDRLCDLIPQVAHEARMTVRQAMEGAATSLGLLR